MFEFLQRVFERIGDGLVWGIGALNNIVNLWEDDYERTAPFATPVKEEKPRSPEGPQEIRHNLENSDTESDCTVIGRNSQNASPVFFLLMKMNRIKTNRHLRSATLQQRTIVFYQI